MHQTSSAPENHIQSPAGHGESQVKGSRSLVWQELKPLKQKSEMQRMVKAIHITYTQVEPGQAWPPGCPGRWLRQLLGFFVFDLSVLSTSLSDAAIFSWPGLLHLWRQPFMLLSVGLDVFFSLTFLSLSSLLMMPLSLDLAFAGHLWILTGLPADSSGARDLTHSSLLTFFFPTPFTSLLFSPLFPFSFLLSSAPYSSSLPDSLKFPTLLHISTTSLLSSLPSSLHFATFSILYSPSLLYCFHLSTVFTSLLSSSSDSPHLRTFFTSLLSLRFPTLFTFLPSLCPHSLHFPRSDSPTTDFLFISILHAFLRTCVFWHAITFLASFCVSLCLFVCFSVQPLPAAHNGTLRTWLHLNSTYSVGCARARAAPVAQTRFPTSTPGETLCEKHKVSFDS